MRRIVLALALAATSLAAAPAQQSSTPFLDSKGNYHIETAEIDSNFENGDFTMPRKVHLTRPGTDATADRAHGNSKQGLATLQGNVVVHDSGSAPEAGGLPYSGSGPATLTCDTLDIDSHAKKYTADGNVHFTQGTRHGTADHGVLDRGNNELTLTGNVHLADGDQSMSAESVEYNLVTRSAKIVGAPVMLTQPAPSRNQPAPSPSAKKK